MRMHLDSKKGYQKRIAINERKILDEKKERSGNKFEENCILEPNTTGLIPPWLRNNSGLNEKMKTASKITNQKGFKGITESNIPKLEERENKIYSGGDLVETSIYSQDHSSDNTGEVNSPRTPRNLGKIPSLWRNKTARQNQCDCNIFKPSYKCRSHCRTLKSENTSLNLMRLFDEHNLPGKERHKSKSQKLKGRIFRKNSCADQKYEKISKTDSRVFQNADPQDVLHCSFKNGDFDPSVSIKNTGVLFLDEKNETDDLAEDFLLLKEMKNQINRNEDYEKFSDSTKRIIEDDISPSKELNFGRDGKDGKKDFNQTEGIEKIKNEASRLWKTESENERITSQRAKEEEIDSKNKDGDEEKKYCDERRKHCERKKWSQKKFIKFPEETKYEKQTGFKREQKNDKMLQSNILEVSQKCRESVFLDNSAEKMNKDREFNTAFLEKMVSGILQKFTDSCTFETTSDAIRNMKSNIIHVIENKLQESEDRENNEEDADTLFTLQESFKSRDENIADVHSSTVNKVVENFRKTVDAAVTPKKESLISSPLAVDQNSVLRLPVDSNENKKNLCKHLMDNVKEKKVGRENDILENENIKDLRKEFEKCLNLIQAQLDITGTKLCSIVLEKIEAEDLANKKVKIIHNNAKGITEAIRIYNERTLNFSDGDGIGMKTCKYPRKNTTESCKPEVKCSQVSQTVEKTLIVNSTQTDLSVIVMAGENNDNFLNENNDFLNESDAEQLLESMEMAMETSTTENRNLNVSAESRTSMESKIEKDKESMLKSISRETSLSEKSFPLNMNSRNCKLRRKIKSYCSGLNYLEEARKKCPKNYLLNLYRYNLNFNVASTNGIKEKEADKTISIDEKDCIEVRTEEMKPQKPEEHQLSGVLYWDGRKMNPGTDLKVHVENLIREKVKEILAEVNLIEQGGVGQGNPVGKIENDPFETAEGCKNNGAKGSPENNPDIEKGCSLLILSENDAVDSLPLSDCTFCDGKWKPASDEAKVHNENVGPDIRSGEKSEKSVHDVGVQSSLHSLLTPNIVNTKAKSRLCTVSKIRKHKIRKEFFEPMVTNSREKMKDIYVKTKSFSGSNNKTSKMKLEFREATRAVEERKDETLASVPRDYSSTGNDSSGDGCGNGGPVCVKLIGIELMKECKRPSENGGLENLRTNESVKGEMLKIEKQRTSESSFSGTKNYRHWELIEHLLNRVDRKEKDQLWNDVSQFVRGKIGRDKNADGTQEICIELEQDIPKFKKGKSSSTVVGKGNYKRKEGDLEVEIDLTLEDLERIVRHRDKNLGRRRYYRKKIKADANRSSNSSVTSAGFPSYHKPYCYGKGGNMHRSESVLPSDTTK